VRVLGAANFRLAIVETVGVGQMEVDIASAADTTVVVTNPGWGDAMQANKAGLLEVADIFVINKADRPGLRETRRDLEQMLELGEHTWRPPIVETTATSGTGIAELWDAIVEHRAHLMSGDFESHRRARLRGELDKVLSAMLRSRVTELAHGDSYDAQLEALVMGTTDPYHAAAKLLAE
jgi:LAO/AO transport system kinase